MKTAKSHHTMKVVDMKSLRRDINLIPDDIKDKFYENYFSQKEEKLRNQQYAHMLMVRNLGRAVAESEVYKSGKFLLGGRDHGMYELFFRQEPSDYISHPQFYTISCRCFGWDVKDPNVIDMLTKLYNTFDVKKKHQMNWRHFLYLFAILAMPELPCAVHFQWGYSILASAGYLVEFASKKLIKPVSKSALEEDEDEDTLSLKLIKQLYGWAADMDHWVLIKKEIDDLWSKMLLSDFHARKLARKNGIENDPDLICIDKYMLKRMLDVSVLFQKIHQIHEFHCFKDKSIWTYEYEKLYYHPILYAELRKIRRERRNDFVANEFIQNKSPRVKSMTIQAWRRWLRRKLELRWFIFKMFSDTVRRQLIPRFSLWKRFTIHTVQAELIQRCVRGFIGRRRCHFIRFLVAQVRKIQPVVRGFLSRNYYHDLLYRRLWAVRTIQRCARGRLARLKARSILLSKIDYEKRKLEKRKKNWKIKVINKASELIQMCWRRYKALKRIHIREDERQRIEKVNHELNTIDEKLRIQRIVHHNEIIKFYKTRRLESENQRLRDESSREHRDRIRELRKKNNEISLHEKRLKTLQIERQVEETRLQQFNNEWDKIAAERAKQREIVCRRSLSGIPESQLEVQLKKILKDKIKKQIKEVLRRADKNKVPMNLPEAEEIAYEEVIEIEKNVEIDNTRREQTAVNEKVKAQQRKSRIDQMSVDEAYKERSKTFGATAIQCVFRQWLARREIRRRMKFLYVKHFDTKTLQYYYENVKLGTFKWHKPKFLGSYDLDAPEGWVAVDDNHGSKEEQEAVLSVQEVPGIYFYNPKTMDMRWLQPAHTLLCDMCQRRFAMATMTEHGTSLINPTPTNISHKPRKAAAIVAATTEFLKQLKKYCEKCFEIKVNTLTETMEPDEIYMRLVDGNKDNKQEIQMTTLEEITLDQFIESKKEKYDFNNLFQLIKKDEEDAKRRGLGRYRQTQSYLNSLQWPPINSRPNSRGSIIHNRNASNRNSALSNHSSHTRDSRASSPNEGTNLSSKTFMYENICPHCESDEHESNDGQFIPAIKVMSNVYCKECMSYFCKSCFDTIHDNDEFRLHDKEEKEEEKIAKIQNYVSTRNKSMTSSRQHNNSVDGTGDSTNNNSFSQRGDSVNRNNRKKSEIVNKHNELETDSNAKETGKMSLMSRMFKQVSIKADISADTQAVASSNRIKESAASTRRVTINPIEVKEFANMDNDKDSINSTSSQQLHSNAFASASSFASSSTTTSILKKKGTDNSYSDRSPSPSSSLPASGFRRASQKSVSISTTIEERSLRNHRSPTEASVKIPVVTEEKNISTSNDADINAIVQPSKKKKKKKKSTIRLTDELSSQQEGAVATDDYPNSTDDEAGNQTTKKSTIRLTDESSQQEGAVATDDYPNSTDDEAGNQSKKKKKKKKVNKMKQGDANSVVGVNADMIATDEEATTDVFTESQLPEQKSKKKKKKKKNKTKTSDTSEDDESDNDFHLPAIHNLSVRERDNEN